MMNLAEHINYKKKNILAAAGGLLLVVLMCGCGREENMIMIGTADAQNTGMMSDMDEETSLLQKEKLDHQKEQSDFRQEQSIFSQEQSNLPQEQSYPRQEQSEGRTLPEGQNLWEEGQMFSDGQQMSSEQERKVNNETLIRIYVCGAVVSPGVVSIPEGSRVEDALLEAGGFTSEAMVSALNLADWVYDGQMLYFPAEGEDLDSLISNGWPWYGFESGQSSGRGQSMSVGQNVGKGQNMGSGQNAGGDQSVGTGQNPASGLVNINTADAALLVTLPGIGESRAQDIIAYREKNGSFTCCEDIMKVSGIKTSVYEKICDKITVK